MMASNDCLENYLLACNQISTSYDQNFKKYYQKRKHLEKKNKEKIKGYTNIHVSICISASGGP